MEAQLLVGALLCAWLPSALSPWGARAQLPPDGHLPLLSTGSAAGPRGGDGFIAAMQEPGMAVHNASSTTLSLSQKRRFHSMKCGPSGFIAQNAMKTGWTGFLPVVIRVVISKSFNICPY